MKRFGFQNLEIYQLAKVLVIEVYKTTNTFPNDEKFALTQQMNRAVVSIPSNIAEGYARYSDKDKAHFLNMAYGSLMEVICQYEIAVDLEYVDIIKFEDFCEKATTLAVKLSNFRNYINDRNNRK